MSHEQSHNAEQRRPWWEMNLSWGDMLIAVLERKVIDPEAPNYPAEHLDVTDATRYFRSINGDDVIVWGAPDAGKHNSLWKVGVTPVAVEGKPLRAPYGFWISDLSDNGLEGYQVADFDSRSNIPISSVAAEALLGMVATMVPVSDTDYGVREPKQ
jgi:hypothetical protein